MKKKRAMDEQSQIDAMRAALRGDLERARSRRGSTLLQPDRPSDPEPEPAPAPAPAPSPSEAAEAEPVVEEPEHEPAAVEEPEPESEPPAVEDAPQPKRGFRFWRR